jgi:hypothetical protein
MLRLARPMSELRPVVEGLAAMPEHPLHLIMAAYYAFGAGHLEKSLDLLDRAQTLMGNSITVEMDLRLYCLVELGRYATKADSILIKQRAPPASA